MVRMDSRKFRNLIKKKISELIQVTSCSSSFLAILQSKGILSAEDVQQIQAKTSNKGKIAAASLFYDILITKSFSSEDLINALKKTAQSGAVSLLQEIEGGSNSTSRFLQSPEYVPRFLSSRRNIMIVYSNYCKFTCEHICDTGKNFHLIKQGKKFLDEISRPVPSNEVESSLPVHNCEGKLNSMLPIIRKAARKCVLVGKFPPAQGNDRITSKNKKYFIAEEAFKWEDLSLSFQYRIQQNCVKLTGIDPEECTKVLAQVESRVICQLIRRDNPELIRETIPDRIQHYIPRRLLTRNVIDKFALFSSEEQDKFLISGMQRHLLSKLKKKSSTSTNIISTGRCNANHKFIVLDNVNHFEKVCKLVEKYPVHLLKYDEQHDILTWVKSVGKVGTVQAMLAAAATQLPIDEKDFHKLVSSESRVPVCISDSPGMGKSVLLASIAASLKSSSAPNHVIFLVMRELVEQLKLIMGEDSKFTDVALLSAMTRMVCANKLGAVYLEQRSDTIKELLLDGFDELDVKDIKLGYDCLNSLQRLFSKCRLWVSTRPHLLFPLERNLNTLGYNIQPFGEEDQINFLKLFWSQDNPRGFNMEKMSKFAKSCLSTVKSKISQAEENFAGIPLQCLLIGEVYKDEAQSYCQFCVDNEDIPIFPYVSIVDLYKKLIQGKLEMFMKKMAGGKFESILALEQVHIDFAIQTLFPCFNKKFYPAKVSAKNIFDVGIVEPNRVRENGPPRFVHRTFAEYFVAKQIVESLASDADEKKLPDLIDLIFENVLRTDSVPLNANAVKLATRRFEMDVVCYFLDVFLLNHQNDLKKGFVERCKQLKPDKLAKFSQACAYNNLENIFTKFFYEVVQISKNRKKVFVDKLAFVCVLKAGEEMTETILNTFESDLKRAKVNGKSELTLLHLAAIRGSYNIVEFLVEHLGFKEHLFEEQFKNLLHECVVKSKGNREDTIREKGSTIKYLTELNHNLGNNTNSNNQLPIQCSGIHVDLAIILMDLTKESYDTSVMLQVVHKWIKSYSQDEFLSLLRHIKAMNSENVCRVVFGQPLAEMPLMHAVLVKNTNPSIQLLEFLKPYTSTKNSTKALYQVAIENKSSSECASWLLKNFPPNNKQTENLTSYLVKYSKYKILKAFLASVRRQNIVKAKRENGDTILHQMLRKDGKMRNKQFFELVAYLLKMGANCKPMNNSGRTPLDELVKTSPSKYGMKVLDHIQKLGKIGAVEVSFLKLKWFFMHQDAKFLEKAARACVKATKINAKDEGGNTLLHFAAERKECKIVKFLLESGSDVNVQNNRQHTPLDCAATKAKRGVTAKVYKMLVYHGAHSGMLNGAN